MSNLDISFIAAGAAGVGYLIGYLNGERKARRLGERNLKRLLDLALEARIGRRG